MNAPSAGLLNAIANDSIQLRDAALEEAAQRLEAKAAKWEKEAQKHLPHWRTSECAARDHARRDACLVHAQLVRELKSTPSGAAAAPDLSKLHADVLRYREGEPSKELGDAFLMTKSGALMLVALPRKLPATFTDAPVDAALIERMAKAMALKSGWDAWDTATTCQHTLSGNEPDEEREFYRDMAAGALAEMRSAGVFHG